MAAQLGLDISKDTIDACLIDHRGQHAKKFPNNKKGFAQIERWLVNRKAKAVHVCMEATGSYYEGVAESLSDSGFLVSVVNPRQIKSYAESLLMRTKTDAIDAILIATFCQKYSPPAWIPPTPEQRKLRGLVRFCTNLKETRASYTVQRQTPNLIPEVADSIDELVANLNDQIEKLEAEIDEFMDSDPDLKRRRDLLCTIGGVGKTTAAVILVNDQGNRLAVNQLEPSAYQRHVGRAGGQQGDGQRELDTLAGGLEDRSHGRKHPAILAGESRGFFFAGFTSR